jgi:hypothetical protein
MERPALLPKLVSDKSPVVELHPANVSWSDWYAAQLAAESSRKARTYLLVGQALVEGLFFSLRLVETTEGECAPLPIADLPLLRQFCGRWLATLRNPQVEYRLRKKH